MSFMKSGVGCLEMKEAELDERPARKAVGIDDYVGMKEDRMDHL